MPINKLHALLNSNTFSRQNAEKVARACGDFSRIVYAKQKATGKAELKSKDICAALALTEALHSRTFRFVAEGHLSHLFGGGCDEDTAIAYFGENVIGTVTDKYGRKITIDEDGMRSLYKERTTGDHEVATENYEEVRGKRLPWIRYTLENTTAVLIEEEPIGRTGGVIRKFYYTATVTVKLKNEPEQTSYYMVVVREGKNQTLRMVTAFTMFERDDFLRSISMARAYVP